MRYDSRGVSLHQDQKHGREDLTDIEQESDLTYFDQHFSFSKDGFCVCVWNFSREVKLVPALPWQYFGNI